MWAIAMMMAFAQAQRSGEAPPALHWNKLKGQCPPGLDWAALRGKVVVISFTAAFPMDLVRWDEDVRAFQNEPDVVFIHVASGSEFLLDQELKQSAVHGCVLFDPDLTNRKNFKLPPYEETVVVDRLGVIAGYSRPEDGIDAIRAVTNYELQTGLSAVPSNPEPARLNSEPAPDDPPSYDVVISDAKDGLRALESGGPMERVYVLTFAGMSPHLQIAGVENWMTGATADGSILGTAQTMQDLAKTFEDVLPLPVIDGTGVTGTYNYFASSRLSGPDAAFDLAHQLGLELTEAEKPIEELVVRSIR